MCVSERERERKELCVCVCVCASKRTFITVGKRELLHKDGKSQHVSVSTRNTYPLLLCRLAAPFLAGSSGAAAGASFWGRRVSGGSLLRTRTCPVFGGRDGGMVEYTAAKAQTTFVAMWNKAHVYNKNECKYQLDLAKLLQSKACREPKGESTVFAGIAAAR